MSGSNWERVYKMAFAKIYPALLAKVEKKGRTKAELDEVIRWLTGYSQAGLDTEIAAGTDMRTFSAEDLLSSGDVLTARTFADHVLRAEGIEPSAEPALSEGHPAFLC